VQNKIIEPNNQIDGMGNSLCDANTLIKTTSLTWQVMLQGNSMFEPPSDVSDRHVYPNVYCYKTN